jgi:hypothetical protein
MPCYIYRHPDTVRPIYRIGTTHDFEHKKSDITAEYFSKITQQWLIYDKTKRDDINIGDYILKTLTIMLEKSRVKSDANYFEIEDIASVSIKLVELFKLIGIELEIVEYLGSLRHI